MANDFPPILAVAALVTNEQGEILLRKRLKEPDSGAWQIVAGYVEPGERLEEAVRRETKEKVGVSKLSDIRFTGYYYDQPGRHQDSSCIPLTFTATAAADSVNDPGDGTEPTWFAPPAVRDLKLALDDRQKLTDAGLI